MLYVIMVQDQEGTEHLREEHRDEHLAHFRSHKDCIALSGPLSDDSGHSVGSLVIIEAESEAEAGDFIRADPFHDAGVWHEPQIARFKGSIFEPEKFGRQASDSKI